MSPLPDAPLGAGGQGVPESRSQPAPDRPATEPANEGPTVPANGRPTGTAGDASQWPANEGPTVLANGRPTESQPALPALAGEGTPAGLPATGLDGQRVTYAGLIWQAALHWLRQVKASLKKAKDNKRGPYHARPPSLAMQNAYRKSRAWVPEGMDGKFLGPAGDIYHRTLGNFGVATGNAWAAMWSRPLAVAIAGAAVLIVWLAFQFG